jgi:predicted phosphate transport protein (TIGR00153 family)
LISRRQHAILAAVLPDPHIAHGVKSRGCPAMKILDLLLPREVEFFKMMNQQADKLVQCAQMFDEFIAQIGGMSEYEVANALKKIREVESAGDEIERNIIEKLHHSFITPIDREDIHAIVTGVDNAIDAMNGTARKIEIYGLRAIPPSINRLSKIILEGSVDIQTLIRSLAKKNQVEKANLLIKRVHDLEKEADIIFHERMAELFKNEKDAGKMIMEKEIYERLEGTTDLLDHIAKIVRGVAVKHG